MQTPALLLFPTIKLGSAEKARSLYLHQAVPSEFGLETTALGYPKASASPAGLSKEGESKQYWEGSCEFLEKDREGSSLSFILHREALLAWGRNPGL